MSFRCRKCKGTGLVPDKSVTCDRCDAYGEVDSLTPEEQAADREELLRSSKEIKQRFARMLGFK